MIRPARTIALASALAGAAALLAFAMHLVDRTLPGEPERAATFIALALVGGLVLTMAGYAVIRRRFVDPREASLLVLSTVSLSLVSVYLTWVAAYVLFPADILLWSESDFMNDIVKLRVGYPIYTAQANNESYHYAPGTQFVTYLIGSLFGSHASIPVYRALQLIFVLIAAVVACFSCELLARLTVRTRNLKNETLWRVFWLLAMFLVATNSLTNPYVYYLHNDALGLVITSVAYCLLLAYISTNDARLLVPMAIVPTAGFLVKQNLLVWAALYPAYLALFDRARSARQIVYFGIATTSIYAIALAGGFWLWGSPFFYWMFVALGRDPISPLRVVEHMAQTWPYFAAGILGGLMLVRGDSSRPLVGAWLVWLGVMLSGAVTSGAGYMTHHLGPGSLIALVWFVVGVARIWPARLGTDVSRSPQTWIRSAAVIAAILLFYVGLGFVRVPISTFPSDARRYIGDIEKEFEGEASDRILLDAGTWIYARSGVVMRDRAPSFGDRGWNGTGDFSGMLGRLNARTYAKILVRNLDSPIFLYDHEMWRQSSGIRHALLENYHVARTIPSVKKRPYEEMPYYFFDTISVLVPNDPALHSSASSANSSTSSNRRVRE